MLTLIPRMVDFINKTAQHRVFRLIRNQLINKYQSMMTINCILLSKVLNVYITKIVHHLALPMVPYNGTYYEYKCTFPTTKLKTFGFVIKHKSCIQTQNDSGQPLWHSKKCPQNDQERIFL